MSDSKKLGGILIENSLMNDRIYQAVVGIGINVNQQKFPPHLTGAISMKQILKKRIDIHSLLIQIVESLKIQIELLEKERFETLFENYIEVLFKKNIPSMFENKNKQKFMGKIIGVTLDGKLKIEKENQVIQEFNFKEIKFIGLNNS
jgi:BirA family biotin operon repressor/biotin-[acetyl-CoA-carboxylase] ligase